MTTKKKSESHDARVKPVPKVRIAHCGKRPIQIRYTDPATKREVRISTNTYDEAAAQAQADAIRAKLVLNIDITPRKPRALTGPQMPWQDFRADYTRLKVATFRSENSKDTAEIRLDVCENIIQPRTLGDMAKPETLARLQAELLTGAGTSKKEPKPRSAHTVRSYIATLIAALNWAHRPMRWLPEAIDFERMEADDPDKGRPLCAEEFERMLAAVPKVIADQNRNVEPDAAAIASWGYLLRGLWESGLRLSEAMTLSWDIEGTIQPHFTKRGLPTLHIPAKMQKSRKAQDVPTTPAFAALLNETPADKRTGWVFNPIARRGEQRLTVPVVGRIISDLGAGIIVSGSGKHASAHDLRRSFAKRLATAGVPIRALQAIMRHSSITTTEAYYLDNHAQDQAELIAKYLGTGEKIQAVVGEQTIVVSADAAT